MRRTLPNFRERLAGLVATLAILAIVLGVPLALVRIFGSPIPSELPDSDLLREPVTADTLLAAVVVLVWLAWLHFVICLAVEAASALRNRGVPRPVPLGGASQPLARRLVVTALLLVAAVGIFDRGPDRATHSAGAGYDRIVATAPAARADDRRQVIEDHVARGAAQAESTRAAARAEQGLVEYDGQFPSGRKVYTVQPPQGRYHDNLWDIAERHLGDGRRYREVFELNRDREQPDGGRLELARLIHPGWVLVMPDDAVGVEVVPERPREVAPAKVSAADSTVDASQVDPGLTVTVDGDGGVGSVDQSTSDTAASDTDAATDASEASGRDLLAAGLLAASLLSALSTLREMQRRRRRPGALLPVPDQEAAEVEVAMRLAADPDSGALLHRALRGLAAACAHAGRSFPDVYAVKVGQRQIELLLATPTADPPPPFTTDDTGRSWSADRTAAFGELPAGAVPPPLPGLIGLGRDKGDNDRHVLVDLEAAAGPVAVTGDPALVHEFLSAAAAELATNGWSGDVQVTCVGLDEGLRALAPDRLRIAVDLDEVITRLEHRAQGPREVLNGPGMDSVITGRFGGERGELFVSEYLVLGIPPTPAQAARLVTLAQAGRLSSVGVLCAGAVDGARWRIELESRDHAAVAVLGLEVVPQRLSAATLEQVITLAMTANREPEPPPPPPEAGSPPASRPPVGHLRLVKPVPTDEPAVEVRILGPLEVSGSTLDEVRRSARTEELVAFLALCGKDGGVGRVDLVTALWPGGASDESVAAALRRARDWLGVDPRTFQPLVEGGQDGPWRLADSVQLDWDVFQSLVLRSRDDDLWRALSLVRGGLLASRPPGRYAWLARTSLEYDVPVLVADTAHRVARMALMHGDVETAAAAARKGLGVDRDSLALWRDLLEAERHRDPAVADRVAAAMRDRFARDPQHPVAADIASGW